MLNSNILSKDRKDIPELSQNSEGVYIYELKSLKRKHFIPFDNIEKWLNNNIRSVYSYKVKRALKKIK